MIGTPAFLFQAFFVGLGLSLLYGAWKHRGETKHALVILIMAFMGLCLTLVSGHLLTVVTMERSFLRGIEVEGNPEHSRRWRGCVVGGVALHC